jgi:MarR family transcriptional regulator, 2-MHQ and catechol-resistance regulon repressor
MTQYQGEEREIQALDAFIGLMRAADTVSVAAHRELTSLNLSISQFGVLEALYHLGPMCQRDLARKILKSTGNITMVIDNLEKRGLVTRLRDQNDRRFFTIQLTSSGQAIISRCFPDHVLRIAKIMAVLTDDERFQLSEICKKLSSYT